MLQLNAYAKLNLSLDILNRRDDGYHDLCMVMQSVSLCDTITLTPQQAGITLACDIQNIPTDQHNIAYQAAAAFFDEIKIPDGVDIRIEKKIPSQAGMAGGSTDAAAVLRGLNQLYRNPLSTEKLCQIGARLGADVPYCILGGSMLAEGIGDKLSPLPSMPECAIVICKPSANVSTAEAFRRADERISSAHRYSSGVVNALHQADLYLLGKSLGNEFEDILPIPEVLSLKTYFLQSGAIGAAMTGSGSAVFALFSDEIQATSAKEHLPKDLFSCICHTVPAYDL